MAITKAYNWATQTVGDFKRAASEIKKAASTRKESRDKYFGKKK
tara:strand:+ start:149 stop:280 length:132 start_codon:yes stop_codon:yes gene_type:complete